MFFRLVGFLALVGCGEPTYECLPNAPPEHRLTLLAPIDLTSEEEGAFRRASASWGAWTGWGVGPELIFYGPSTGRLHRTTSLEGIERLDAAWGVDVIAQANSSDIWFVPSRIHDASELEVTFAHEMGHLLSIGHVSERGALMFKRPTAGNGAKTEIDRRAFQACYLDRLRARSRE